MKTAESFSSVNVFDAGALDYNRRFGGLTRLYGVAGAARIRAGHLVIVGLGGVGSWAAEAAARSGVAKLTLIDLDHVAESNINRQVHALQNTLGQSKVQAMRERILQIHPACQVIGIEDFVAPDNWPDLVVSDMLEGNTRVVIIDACDQIKAKIAMASWAIEKKMRLVTVGAAGGKRYAHLVNIADLSLVTHDPLLAQLRYRLRKMQAGARSGIMQVACVFSPETVASSFSDSAANLEGIVAPSEQTSQSEGSLNCHGYGSVVTVTATFGMCATSWALNKIAA